MRHLILPLVCTCAFAFPVPSQQQPPPVLPSVPSQAPAASVDELLVRVGQYVVQYGQEMEVVIGVEHYAQWLEADGFARGTSQATVSEFALFRVGDDWMGFRDVHEVDGKPVGDRQDRLLRLVTESPGSAVEQGRRIAAESARYNFGGAIQRNFNVPTTALFFMRPVNQPRFKFKKAGEEQIDGIVAWEIKYDETRRPTIIRTSQGKDMPLTGSIWADPRNGRVLRTRMELKSETTMSAERIVDPGHQADAQAVHGDPVVMIPSMSQKPDSLNRKVQTSATITVSYREEARLGLLVPVEMRESYVGAAASKFTGRESASKIDCRATYSDFKRFETSGRVVPPK